VKNTNCAEAAGNSSSVLFVNKVQSLPSDDVRPMSLFIVALISHSKIHSAINVALIINQYVKELFHMLIKQMTEIAHGKS
jgi:hypothetical protein